MNVYEVVVYYSVTPDRCHPAVDNLLSPIWSGGHDAHKNFEVAKEKQSYSTSSGFGRYNRTDGMVSNNVPSRAGAEVLRSSD